VCIELPSSDSFRYALLVDLWKRHWRRWIGLGGAVLAVGVSALWFSGHRLLRPAAPEGRYTVPGEQLVPLNVVQPYPGGMVTLIEMWNHEHTPGHLRIFAKFVGEDPRERFHVMSRVREEKNGFENGYGTFGDVGGVNVPAGETLTVLGHGGAPVAAEKLFVRLYFLDKATRKLEPTVSFEIKNTLRRKPERWTAEPLPATRVSGPLKIELLKMETGFVGGTNGWGFSEGDSRLVMHVLENGAPVAHWRVTYSQFSTGSGLQMYGSGEGDAGEGLIGVRTSTLWKSEGTWKARLHFEREDEAAPGESIEVHDMPVPAEGAIELGNRHWKLGEMNVHFLGLSGGHTNALAPRPGNPPAEVEACFQIFGGTPQRRFRLLSMTDEAGKPLFSQFESPRWSVRGPDEPITVALPPGARPKKVSFKIGVTVYEQIEVEFLAKPTFLNERYVPPSG
jgi:hypothetical protein